MTPATSAHAAAERTPVRSVVAVGVLFIALGVLDLYRGLAPLLDSAGPGRLATDDMQVLAIGIAALVGATGVLRGYDWARWLLAAWMALHVVISVGQPAPLIAHLVIFGGLAYLLFRPAAAMHFDARRPVRPTPR